MNYTTNYHLPQWAETDRIMMEDFNEAMTALDQGIKTAQDTADTAESKADAAQTTANSVADAYTPDNKPYVIGTYKGNSAVTKITLGFQPSALIIARNYSSSDAEDSYGTCTIIANGGTSGVVLFNNDGFTLFPNNPNIYPSVNRNNHYYYYIALR